MLDQQNKIRRSGLEEFGHSDIVRLGTFSDLLKILL